MKNLNRLRGAITMCVLAAGSTVYAQQAEPTLTDPPQAPQCEAPANCPPQEGQTQAAQQPEMTQPPPAPEPQPQPTTVAVSPPDVDVYVADQDEWYEEIGFGLALGGGVDDFVGEDYRDTTGLGGGWNLRATVGTQSVLGFEGSYFGSAQEINALGLDDDAILYGNGLQAAARLNVIPGYSVQPFLYGGAAWRHYDVSSDGINTSDIEDSDDVFEIPVGVGLAGYISGFMADVRAEYRGALGTDLIPTVDDDEILGEGDRWSVNASLGMAF